MATTSFAEYCVFLQLFCNGLQSGRKVNIVLQHYLMTDYLDSSYILLTVVRGPLLNSLTFARITQLFSPSTGTQFFLLQPLSLR